MTEGQFQVGQRLQFESGDLSPNFLEPPKSLVLINRTAGTNIGDMTDSGGLSAAFDGNTSQSQNQGARSPSRNPASGWCGKTLAAPKIFGQAIAYGANNHGFLININVAVTLNIRGKNGAAPSSRTDGTIIGTTSFTDTTNESAGRTIDSTNLVDTWDHIFLEILATGSHGGNEDCSLAELVLYEWA